MNQDTIERAWVATFRADLERQRNDLEHQHNATEEALKTMARNLDRLQGAIEGIDALLAEADTRAAAPAVVENGWPIGG